ncbi:Hint domain-containing protein [Cognatiyoonia koreensis]|uniref:Hint domain-containing protein n=1 Tax=Cognatiyoonia koreensis TaxID=364200 RepID=A0A1I0NMK6_9RHOB|nr:Hint domain-containing protein [Cognatiyoonia koreensis]SEW02494.1 Hint domain-containing protein [Cognatiyoonia koreensis]
MPDPSPSQTVAVYAARAFRVTDGVAEGEGISFADELVLDDVYQLSNEAARLPLTLSATEKSGGFVVSDASATGLAGNQVVLDCCLTLMAPDSTTYEALVLVEVVSGGVEAVYLLPLATLRPLTDYRLVGVDRHAATTRFAEVACVSFTRGTHITLASGRQIPIEEMKVGDRVLTRDDGPQAVRWIGQTTLRAVGDFAPVVIKKGALHNEHDLVVSPDHRIFVYQRQDRLGAGRNEVLIKVRHLINGESVYQRDGGFVDYFQLLFDDHQIIYAEGIAAESLLIDPRTRDALPTNATKSGRHAHRRHLDYEVQEQLLAQPDAVELLRKASSS